MIESFYVNNYKCLVDVRVPLTPIHVIIGQNDSGKTSLLEAMLALSRSTKEQIHHAFPGEWQERELVYAGAGRPIISLEVRIGANAADIKSPITYHLDVDFGIPQAIQTDEWVENGGRTPITQATPGWTGVANKAASRITPLLRSHFDSISAQLGSVSLYRFDPRLMATPAAIVPNRKFHMDTDGFGLATLLDDILGYDAGRFLDLRREFCDFFPQFRSVRIESVAARFRQPQENNQPLGNWVPGKAIFFELASGGTIRAQQASDGAILFLGLLALIHSPEPPKLLLIEEPEKGVYPKRLEEIIGLLRRVQEAPSGRPAPQIIMTTHSPYVLDSFDPTEVTLMVRRDGGKGPVAARPLRDAPNIDERLGRGEFYLGELWYNLSEDELFAHVGA